jgi:hypothetical protein
MKVPRERHSETKFATSSMSFQFLKRSMTMQQEGKRKLSRTNKILT